MNNTTIIQDNTTIHPTWLLSFVLLWARFYLALPLFETCWSHLMNWGSTLNLFASHSFTILPSSLSGLIGMKALTISADVAAYLTIFGGFIIAIMILVGLFGRFFSCVIVLSVTLILVSRAIIDHTQSIYDMANLGEFLVPVLDFVVMTAGFLNESLILMMWTPEVLSVALIILGLILMFTGPGRISLDSFLSSHD